MASLPPPPFPTASFALACSYFLYVCQLVNKNKFQTLPSASQIADNNNNKKKKSIRGALVAAPVVVVVVAIVVALMISAGQRREGIKRCPGNE